MTKNVWVQPRTVVQQFVANEAVSACGDHGVNYLFTCNAGGGTPGTVYVEDNGKDGLQTTPEWVGGWPWEGGYLQSADSSLGGYEACGTTHEASTQAAFLSGYYVPYGSDSISNVIIWRGLHNDNVHCTTNLNMDEWETDRS